MCMQLDVQVGKCKYEKEETVDEVYKSLYSLIGSIFFL